MQYAKDQLIVGKYYTLRSEEFHHPLIFKYTGQFNAVKHHFISHSNEYHYGMCCNNDGLKFSDATEEQIIWLDCCIAAGETVAQMTLELPKESHYEIC